MADHTPGPWVAEVEDNIHFVGKTGRIRDVAQWISSEANARLIAAAPEMLTALRLAAISVPPYSHCQDIILAAIARATGEK